MSPKGWGKSAAVCIFVCLFFESVCVGCPLQLNRGPAYATERERGLKQIKHKPTNHRRRLISAVLKGEPGMSDEPPL